MDNARPLVPETEKETAEEKKEDNGNLNENATFLPTERPVQKNKKKCWVCKAKLELAQRELGGCKCGKCPECVRGVCLLHRMFVSKFFPSKNLAQDILHN